MLFRFCLYGLLKNQRYFEPFLLLALVEKELSFFQIGVLVAIREATVNLLEVPSGAAADLLGRRGSLVLSFVAYLVSFVALGLATSYVALAGAMVLFGVGEAFRSGTHKALIFRWLEQHDRLEEKTRVYGLTRSFSKFGSAVSSLAAAALVFTSSSYTSAFLWSALPCALNALNVGTYPASIDARPAEPVSLRSAWHHVRDTLRDAAGRPWLRGMLLESMGYNGLFKAAKDYLQPALAAAAVLWLGGRAADLEDVERTALLVGPVYAVLSVLSGVASLRAHRFAVRAGGEEPAARRLWILLAGVLVVLAFSSAAHVAALAIVAFVALHVLQNLWRPILTSRIYSQVESGRGATLLSIESQSHRVATVVLAPLFGWLVDSTGSFGAAAGLAAAVAVGFVVWGGRRSG